MEDCVAVAPSYGAWEARFQGINFCGFETFCGGARGPPPITLSVVPANAGTHNHRYLRVTRNSPQPPFDTAPLRSMGPRFRGDDSLRIGGLQDNANPCSPASAQIPCSRSG